MRVIVQSCSTTMNSTSTKTKQKNAKRTVNVTVKLPDALCRAARHRAVDDDQSLSAWLAALIEREINGSSSDANGEAKTWMEAMHVPGMPEEFYEKELPLEGRRKMKAREFEFVPDEE